MHGVLSQPRRLEESDEQMKLLKMHYWVSTTKLGQLVYVCNWCGRRLDADYKGETCDGV